MAAPAADPVQRIYFGILFCLDLVVTLFVYVCLNTFSQGGWNESWTDEVADYSLSRSCFDLAVLSIIRSLVLLLAYTFRGMSDSLMVMAVFGCSVIGASVKAAVFEEINIFRALMLATTFSIALVEVIVVVRKLRNLGSRSRNPFFSSQSVLYTSPVPAENPFSSLDFSRISLLHPSLQRNGIDSRYIPTTSAKKSEWGLSNQDQIISALVTESRDNTTWKLLIDNSDTLVFTKENAKKSVLCFKSISIIPADSQTLYNYLAEETYRTSWNVLFNQLTKVEEISNGIDIVHVTMPALGPVQARDFCCVKVKRHTIEGGAIIGMKSIFHPDKPETHKYARGEMSLHGYHIRPHKKAQNTSLLYHIFIADLKGWVPNRIVDLIAEYQAKVLVNLKQVFQIRESASSSNHRDSVSLSAIQLSTSLGTSPITGGRTRSDTRRLMKTDVEFDNVADGDVLVRTSSRKNLASGDSSARDNNLLPRVKSQGLPSDSLILELREFMTSWKDLLIMAVDLHLEDRVSEASGVIQAILRSLEQHRMFIQEHITEDEYWKRDNELAKISQQLEDNPFVQIIQRDNFEAEGWIKELQNRSDWRPISLSNQMQIWSRNDQNARFATFLCEGCIESPLADCFSILNEVEQMHSWLPRLSTQLQLNIKVIANLTRMSKLVHVTGSLPFPMHNREIIGIVKGMDILEQGHILILFQSIDSFEGIELPPSRPDYHRIKMNASVLLSPISNTQTHLTLYVSVDMQGFYPMVMPLRLWAIRSICQSVFSMLRLQSQEIIGSDFEMIMAENPDLYDFIKQRSSSFVERMMGRNFEETFDGIVLHTR